MLAHHAYPNNDQAQVLLVQVHPTQRPPTSTCSSSGQALALSRTVRVDVYGQPGPVIQQALDAHATAGVPAEVKSGSWIRLMTFTLEPIGIVHTERKADTDHWGAVDGTIVVEDRLGNDCLAGLADSSHIEVLFPVRSGRRAGRLPHPAPPTRASGSTQLGVPAESRTPQAEPGRRDDLPDHRGRQTGAARARGCQRDALKPVMAEPLPRRVRQPAPFAKAMHDYL